MMENYENLTLEQLKLYKASIEEYAEESELLDYTKYDAAVAKIMELMGQAGGE